MSSKQKTADFETFVRNAFSELNKSINNLNTSHVKQTEQIEQLTKTVNKHAKFLSKIETHDEQISALGKDVCDLKYMRKVFEEQGKRNKQLESDLKAAKASVKQMEDLCIDLQTEIRMMATNKNPADPFEDIEACLIVVNLGYDENEDVAALTQELLATVIPEDTPGIIQAIRLKPRSDKGNRDGVIKVALASRKDRVLVLKSKSGLAKHPKYEDVWINPCKSRNELVAESNMRTLLRMVPDGKKFRMRNGRITDTSTETRTAVPPAIPKAATKRRRVVSGENTEHNLRFPGARNEDDMETVVEEPEFSDDDKRTDDDREERGDEQVETEEY